MLKGRSMNTDRERILLKYCLNFTLHKQLYRRWWSLREWRTPIVILRLESPRIESTKMKRVMRIHCFSFFWFVSWIEHFLHLPHRQWYHGCYVVPYSSLLYCWYCCCFLPSSFWYYTKISRTKKREKIFFVFTWRYLSASTPLHSTICVISGKF